MLQGGYAAVTSRRVEVEAGITLHYHFGTLDDLFIAVVRRHGESTMGRLADALSSPEPLRAWWRLVSDRRGSGLRPRSLREVRRLQIETLATVLDEYGIEPRALPARVGGVSCSRNGLRDGGYGRELGREAIDGFVDLKAISVIQPKKQFPPQAFTVGSAWLTRADPTKSGG